MKTRYFAVLTLATAWGTHGVAQILTPSSTSAATAVPSNSPHLTAEQLDQLLGPIALYPDALIALILPASTVPSDVVLAARYLNGGDPSRVDEQPWDDSVRALAHYPDLVKWMDENLRWTQQVGEAFLDQPAEVMKSVQHLRAEARAAGTLVDTIQQQVVVESDTISIVPTQPDVIYVPYYDPEVVYVRHDRYSGPFFSFSIGYPTGFWLGYNVDWGHRRLWVVDRRDRERYWREQHDWRRPVFPARPNVDHEPDRHAWTPPAAPRPVRPGWTNARPEVVRPAPISRGTSHITEVRRESPQQPPPIPMAPISTQPAGTLPQPPQPINHSQPAAISRGTREVPHEEHRPSRDEHERERERDRNVPTAAPNVIPPNPGRISLPTPPGVPAPPAAPIPVPGARQERAPATTVPAPTPPAQPSRRQPPPDSDDDGHHRRSDNERDR